jgi:tripartite-type tricarboxylate transporter receptor subunit TctC
MRGLRWKGFVAIAALSTPVMSAAAADLDCRTIEVVVPYSAGAFVDALGRVLAVRLTKAFGKQAIVVNRPGGSTIPATISVVNAKPDGCTILLIGAATLTINPTLQRGKLPYDTIKDLAPISVLASSPAMIMANPALGVETVAALVDLDKRQRGKINYASPGMGSNPHLGMEYFKLKTGTEFVHVPYRGLAPATTDLLANHVQLLFSSPAGFEDHVKSGRLKALGVSGNARLKALPDVPLLVEIGYGMSELDSSSMFGLLTSSRTPAPTIEALAAFVNDAVRDPQFAADIEKIGLQPAGGTPDKFRDIIAHEIQRWADIIKKAGIRAD